MREKDYQKLYECEFPVSEAETMLNRKVIFQCKLQQKPIVLDVRKLDVLEKDHLHDLLWQYGIFVAFEDYHGWYGMPTMTVNMKVGGTHNHGWRQYMKGRKFRIRRDEFVLRVPLIPEDFEINKCSR